MANVPESMLRLKPVDTWSTREKLALATYAQKNNDQNFSSSKGLKSFAEPNRPDDWFSRKMCALQYREMIDMFENDQKDVPKRKRRDKGTKETSIDMIVKNLTEQRLSELQESIPKLIFEQCRLQAKLDKLKDPSTRKEFIEEARKYVLEHRRQKEEQEKEHEKWLAEREAKINNMMKQPILVRQQPPKMLVKQEAVDIDTKPIPEMPTITIENTEKDVPEMIENKPSNDTQDITDSEMAETIKSESDDKTETSEDIIMEDNKTAEPESPESQVEVIEEIAEDKHQAPKIPKTPTNVRPTRSHSKSTPEPMDDVIIEDDENSQASTVDSVIEDTPSTDSKQKDLSPEKSDTKFNKRGAIKVLSALQNHRYSSLISSPVAMKIGKEMIVKKIDIQQIKKKIEGDQINSNDEFTKCLTLLFLGALYSNNIDWSSQDYSHIVQMQKEIMAMIAAEEKQSGQRSKRI